LQHSIAATISRAVTWIRKPSAGFRNPAIVQPFGVERGKNFSFAATLALARARGYQITAFGPFEIAAETYARALGRIRLLNSGTVAYTMINGPEGAINCIEAVASVGGPVDTALSYGFEASEMVANHLARNPSQVDHDAAERLHISVLLGH
jgi:hypothetical protein